MSQTAVQIMDTNCFIKFQQEEFQGPEAICSVHNKAQYEQIQELLSHVPVHLLINWQAYGLFGPSSDLIE